LVAEVVAAAGVVTMDIMVHPTQVTVVAVVRLLLVV
jgi:hypothetical protein